MARANYVPQAMRNPGPAQVSDVIPQGTKFVHLIGLSTVPDLSDARNQVSYVIHLSSDQFVDNVIEVHRETWTGGLIPDKQNPGQQIPNPMEHEIGVETYIGAEANWMWRVSANIVRRMNLGLDVETR
jgi:hypothetical protein